MRPGVLLCVAPILSVLRPALGPGLLKHALKDMPVRRGVRYLNIEFADRIGVDLNEWLADDVPTHLLAGDWLFSHLIVRAKSNSRLQHIRELRRSIGASRFRQLARVREAASEFVEASADEICREMPAFVGFSTVFQQTGASLALAAAIKKRNPDIHISFGGANCHGPMGPALLDAFEQIDSVFTGYADRAFPRFIRNLIENKREPVEGVATRTNRSNGIALLASLDDLPEPDFTDYFSALEEAEYGKTIRPALLIEGSRGCWWGQKHHCTFCGLNAENLAFNAKTSPRFLSEIEALSDRYGIDRFCATDNILAMPHIDGVFGKLGEANPGYSFFVEIKANLTEAKLRTLARGGVTWVQPGIESLDDTVLTLMRKGVRALTNIRLLRNCLEIGLGAIWNILYGFPGESGEAYARMAGMAPLLEHLQPPTSCSKIRIDRFSPNFNDAEAMGFSEVRPVVAYGALFGGDTSWQRDVAYFFEGNTKQGGDFGYAVKLRDIVKLWRSAWYEAGAIPELRLEAIGGIGLIKDTRRCAEQSMHVLDQHQLAVLRAFRDPTTISHGLMSVERAFPGHDHAGSFEQLVARAILVVDGNSALSLPVNSGVEAVQRARRERFPWGWREPTTHAPSAAKTG